MYGLVSTAIIVGCALYLFHKLEPLISRALSIAEQNAETRRQDVLKPLQLQEEPMPRDFVEWAMNESTEWAREDKLTRMRELYGRLKNWEKVRMALMHEEEVAVKSTF